MGGTYQTINVRLGLLKKFIEIFAAETSPFMAGRKPKSLLVVIDF